MGSTARVRDGELGPGRELLRRLRGQRIHAGRLVRVEDVEGAGHGLERAHDDRQRHDLVRGAAVVAGCREQSREARANPGLTLQFSGTHTYIYIYVCVCVRVYICSCIHAYIHISGQFGLAVHTHTYIYIYMCVCVYIYVVAYTHINIYRVNPIHAFMWMQLYHVKVARSGRRERERE